MGLLKLELNPAAIDAVLKDVVGPGGVIDDLQTSPDPTGLEGAINDGDTIFGDLLGPGGLLEDLGSADPLGAALADLLSDGGVLGDLMDGDGLATGHLLGGDALLGNLLGASGVVDDALF